MSNAHEAPPSMTLVAGKYQLIGMIGRGGMGSVWEGRHASLGTRVAIKFIDSEFADSQEARSRFDNEARAAASIQSKHAIQIFDHGVTDDGKPYIVMEMLQGEPLDKRIDLRGRLSLQETARIIGQVCRGLQRAHERGIIHRDLKPENIFLVRTADDDDEIAKVLDFGIAKMKGPPGEKGLTSSTKTGAVLGTPFFMSPEQARGLRNVDHRTDLWSLGVITYKCVTGQLPFDGESVGDLLVKICTSPLPVPSQWVQGLPPAFDAWFMRALDREPDRRFATAQELSDALNYAAGLSVRRPPGSAQPGDANPAYERTSLQATPRSLQPAQSFQQPPPGTLQSTPGRVAMGGSSPGYGQTSAPFTAPARPPGGSGKVIFSVAAAFLGLGIAAAGGFFALRHSPAPNGAGVGSPGIVVSSVVATAVATGSPSISPVVSSVPAVTTTLASDVLTPGTKPTATSKPGLAATTRPGAKPPAIPAPTAPSAKPTATATAAPIVRPPPPPKKGGADPGY